MCTVELQLVNLGFGKLQVVPKLVGLKADSGPVVQRWDGTHLSAVVASVQRKIYRLLLGKQNNYLRFNSSDLIDFVCSFCATISVKFRTSTLYYHYEIDCF